MSKNTILRFVFMILLLARIKAYPCQAQELSQHDLNEYVCSKAVEVVKKYLAFTEDYLDFAYEKIQMGDSDYIYNQQEILMNIDELRKQEEFINRSDKSTHNTINMMLHGFLGSRFEVLGHRYARFLRREFIDDGTERMQEKIACNTTICQFYDQLITDIYLLASQKPLSYEIHSLISISPSLWPLLTKASEELPNPDQATYGKLNDRSSMGPNGDLYLFKTYYEKSELFQLPVYGLGVPKGTTITTRMTRYQRNQIDKKYRKIEERQFPEWLQIAKAQSEEPSCISPDITPPHSEQAEVLSHDTIVDFAEAQIVEALATAQAQAQAQEKTTTIGRSTEAVCTEVVSDTYFVEKTECTGPSKDALSKTSRKNIFSSSSALPRLAPKGMRAFHPHTQTFRVNSTKLNYKHLRTYINLMESGSSSSLSYADYSSLWRAINGKNSIRESTGSSHKILLDADGKVVAGIFAHNKSMEYTKRTFSYLRDAISRLGINPEIDLVI
jgi:hypothetical protein